MEKFDIVDSMASAVALLLEAECEKQGWNQPPRLYDIIGTDLPTEILNTATEALGVVSPDTMSMAFELRDTNIVTDQPSLDIPGHICNDDVLGAVVVAEGWRHPSWLLGQLRSGEISVADMKPPSEYEDRVEVRLTHCMFRDGTEHVVSRDRDSDPVEMTGDSGGRLSWALRRYLRLPSHAPTVATPRQMYAWALVSAALIIASADNDALYDLYGSLPPLDASDPASLVEPVVPFAASSPLGQPLAPLLAFLAIADSWDVVYEALVRMFGIADGRIPAGATAFSEFLHWADPPLLAARLAFELNIGLERQLTNTDILARLDLPTTSPTAVLFLTAAHERIETVFAWDSRTK